VRYEVGRVFVARGMGTKTRRREGSFVIVNVFLYTVSCSLRLRALVARKYGHAKAKRFRRLIIELTEFKPLHFLFLQ